MDVSRKFKEVRRGAPIGFSLILAAVLAGCGGGSSNSGAGIRSAEASPDTPPPIGAIPLNVETPITQSGSYTLPNVEFITDISLSNCPNAAADAAAVSASTDRVSALSCNGGPAITPNFPAGGGILTVNLNSGNPIGVRVVRALSLTTSNR